MVGVIVTPNLEKSLIERTGIVTVPDEDATVSCSCLRGNPNCRGIRISKLPLKCRTLEQHMRFMGDKFIARMAVRGLEWVGGDMRLHGPRTSYLFNERMSDVGSPSWGEARSADDPGKALYHVFDEPDENGYSDYTLVGEFLVTNTLTEVVVND